MNDARMTIRLPGSSLAFARRYASEMGVTVTDLVVRYFAVIPADAAVFRFARTLGMEDFEDAVVAASAATSGCAHIITRNVADFQKSPVPALQPAEFLSM